MTTSPWQASRSPVWGRDKKRPSGIIDGATKVKMKDHSDSTRSSRGPGPKAVPRPGRRGAGPAVRVAALRPDLSRAASSRPRPRFLQHALGRIARPWSTANLAVSSQLLSTRSTTSSGTPGRGRSRPSTSGLLDLLNTLARTLPTQEPFHVISGYRSPSTNSYLRTHGGGGVAAHSLHLVGKAIDIRVPGIKLRDLYRTAISLHGGGVGIYPESDFVHVDVGRVRTW